VYMASAIFSAISMVAAVLSEDVRGNDGLCGGEEGGGDGDQEAILGYRVGNGVRRIVPCIIITRLEG
jgi:hypothetical protein